MRLIRIGRRVECFKYIKKRPESETSVSTLGSSPELTRKKEGKDFCRSSAHRPNNL